MEAAIAAAKEAVQSDDAERITSATNNLAQVAMKIGEAIYSSQPASDDDGSAGGDEPKAEGDDNVVDADFEEVKDDKKSA